MIDPKELRIGNLGQVDGKEVVYGQCPNGNTHGGSDISVYWHRIKKDWGIFSYSCAQVEPIPITPEWLERLDIKKDFWGERTIKTEGQIRVNINNNGVFVIAEEIDDKLPHIEYVHQLQNLYFALTGKELTVKQPETI